MGIPHLITFLQPYVEPETLTGKHVVVDGPAFAYHVYYLCCSSRPRPRSVFDALPSYAEIGDTALRWLDGIRECDATINKIYFDGFLPHSKYETRLGRLIDLTSRLSNFYHANSACRLSFLNGESPEPHLYNNNRVESYSMALPPVSFLVPAVLEALKTSSHYMNVVEVVPGEADLYCSEYLRLHGGIVFTGDSDLLVHDLGVQGAVSFFKSVKPSLDTDPKLLGLEVYNPKLIAQRLSLPPAYGLRSLAFELFVDRHGTFPKLVSQARDLKAIQKHKEMYENFHTSYSIVLQMSPQLEPQGIGSVLRSLDPRISEYALQFPSIAKLSGQETSFLTSTSSPHIFLPFLLDCTVRKSAWEMSTAVRQLAYGLVNLIVPDYEQVSTVFEHKRQHDKSNGRELEVPKTTELHGACADMANLLKSLKSRLRKLSQPDIWVAVAVYQDIQWSYTNSKRALSVVVRDCEFEINHKQSRNWDIVQLVAQIESSYYSFRILHQLTSLVILKLPDNPMAETILLLHHQIRDLPLMSQFKCFAQAVPILNLLKETPLVEVALDIAGYSENKTVKPQAATNKVAKNKRSRGARVKKLSKSHKGASSNAFEALTVE